MSSDLPDGLLDSGGDQEGDGSAESNAVEQSYERFTIVSIGDHRLALPVTHVDTVINRHVETTRIPRAPEAVEGVTDIRGQITTIVDPHVHFPDSGGPAGTPSLLVFADRDQPAATWVDEVEGVEAVPEDGIVEQSAYERSEIEGTALEHPLIVGAIRVERRRRGAIVESVTGQAERDAESDRETDPFENSLERTETDEGDVVVGEFSLDDEADGTESRDEPGQSPSDDVEVEVTPILDVDRFLLAAGRVEEERDPVTDTTADHEAAGVDPAESGSAGTAPDASTAGRDQTESAADEGSAAESESLADDESGNDTPADTAPPGDGTADIDSMPDDPDRSDS